MLSRRRFTPLWIAAAVVVVLAVCGTDVPSQAPVAQPATPPGAPGDDEEVTSVACVHGGIVRTSFEELEREATAIVIGTGTGENRPMEELEPGTNFGVAYQVEVERYLKGAGPDMLPIYQVEGCVVTVIRGGGKQLRGPWVDALSPIREGVRYLFFLRPHPYLPDPDVMRRVAHPSRFVLDGGTASPDGPWPGPTTAWPAMPESDLIVTVEEIVRVRPVTARLQARAAEIAALVRIALRTEEWGQIQRLSVETFGRMDESAFARAALFGIVPMNTGTGPDDWQVDRLGAFATVRLKANPGVVLAFVQSGEDWLLDLGPEVRWLGTLFEAGKNAHIIGEFETHHTLESSRDTGPIPSVSEDPISLRIEGSRVVYSFRLYFRRGLPATMSRDSMRWLANGQQGPLNIVWTNGILTEDAVRFPVGLDVDVLHGQSASYRMSVILDGLPNTAPSANVRLEIVLGDGEILQHTRTFEIKEYPKF